MKLLIAFATLAFVTSSFAAPIVPADTELAHYELVQITTHDGLILDGHLATPKNSHPPYPAVLMLVGSGAGNRYEDAPATVTADGRPTLLFKPIETALLEKGIAVMVYDKRGVHPADETFLKSVVDRAVFQTASANNLAADALAAFDKMQTLNSLDRDRLGVLGHSEGTALALKVMERRSTDVRALFMLGLFTRSLSDVLVYQAVANGLRLFYALDDNQDGYVDELEAANALAQDSGMAAELPPWPALLTMADKTKDGKISEPELRYYLESQVREMMRMVNDKSLPWPEGGLPREWLGQYFAEGAYLSRQIPYCARIHLFQGQIDVQTPFEDALELNDACNQQATPLASFHSYVGEGHAFSPRIGYKKIRDTIGPIDPQVPGDIAIEAARALLGPWPVRFASAP